MPSSETYRQVIFTRHVATVVEAPELALLSVNLLRQLDTVYFAGPDLLYIGNLEDGTKVHYRITGWDTDQKALIMQREPMAPVSTKKSGEGRG
jgi:hypothetical protein